jgi:competence protein ComEA
MKNWQLILLSVFTTFAASALILLISQEPRGNFILLPTRQPPSPLSVYITGAVNQVGLYELPSGSRVNDAVVAAKGLRSNADLAMINLAAPLADGQHIHIPRIGESPPPDKLSEASDSQTTTVPLSKDDPININTASIDELDALPGIGETRAQDIINYRDVHGAFQTINDLMNVPGIGETIFNSIKEYITVAANDEKESIP